MSFAIIETGGKQYKVSASKILEVELLDSEKGKTMPFDVIILQGAVEEIPQILLEQLNDGGLLDNVKDRTVLIFHKRRRKHSRKKNGHRQRHSKIQISKIFSKDGKVIAEAKLDIKPKKIEEVKQKKVASEKLIKKK